MNEKKTKTSVKSPRPQRSVVVMSSSLQSHEDASAATRFPTTSCHVKLYITTHV